MEEVNAFYKLFFYETLKKWMKYNKFYLPVNKKSEFILSISLELL